MQVVVHPFKAGFPLDLEAFITIALIPFPGPPHDQAGNKQDHKDEGAPANNRLAVGAVQQQAPVDAFYYREEVVLVVDDPGYLTGVGIYQCRFVIFNRSLVGESGVVPFVRHKLPGHIGPGIGGDAENRFIRPQRLLGLLFQLAYRKYGRMPGGNEQDITVVNIIDFFLENKQAAGDADNQHHNP